jgi:hypothetical protein
MAKNGSLNISLLMHFTNCKNSKLLAQLNSILTAPYNKDKIINAQDWIIKNKDSLSSIFERNRTNITIPENNADPSFMTEVPGLLQLAYRALGNDSIELWDIFFNHYFSTDSSELIESKQVFWDVLKKFMHSGHHTDDFLQRLNRINFLERMPEDVLTEHCLYYLNNQTRAGIIPNIYKNESLKKKIKQFIEKDSTAKDKMNSLLLPPVHTDKSKSKLNKQKRELIQFFNPAARYRLAPVRPPAKLVQRAMNIQFSQWAPPRSTDSITIDKLINNAPPISEPSTSSSRRIEKQPKPKQHIPYTADYPRITPTKAAALARHPSQMVFWQCSPDDETVIPEPVDSQPEVALHHANNDLQTTSFPQENEAASIVPPSYPHYPDNFAHFREHVATTSYAQRAVTTADDPFTIYPLGLPHVPQPTTYPQEQPVVTTPHTQAMYSSSHQSASFYSAAAPMEPSDPEVRISLRMLPFLVTLSAYMQQIPPVPQYGAPPPSQGSPYNYGGMYHSSPAMDEGPRGNHSKGMPPPLSGYRPFRQ